MAGVTFVRGASLDEEIAATFNALVGSIDLPPELAARVREIIARSVTVRAALASPPTERAPAPSAQSGRVIPGAWAQAMLLHAERDAAIRSLLTNPDHQRAFDANAAAMQRQLDAIRPGEST
jgi:hypothetical protein